MWSSWEREKVHHQTNVQLRRLLYRLGILHLCMIKQVSNGTDHLSMAVILNCFMAALVFIPKYLHSVSFLTLQAYKWECMKFDMNYIPALWTPSDLAWVGPQLHLVRDWPAPVTTPTRDWLHVILAAPCIQNTPTFCYTFLTYTLFLSK